MKLLLPLTANEVHLWWTPRTAVADDALMPWVTALERQRAGMMTGARRRAEWLGGRALLRACLSHYTGIEPQALPLTASAAGKPCLALDTAPAFSLSHGGRWIACAVAQAALLGLDIDCTARANDTAAIAARFFHPLEQQAIATADDPHAAFFFHWTLKEAYIKAMGTTIGSAHLGLLPFGLRSDAPVPLFQPEGDGWVFRQCRFDGDHQLALACRWRQCDTGNQSLRCRSWQWDPVTQQLLELTEPWPC